MPHSSFDIISQLLQAAPGRNIAVPFRFLILFAELNRLDVTLADGGQVLAISHDGLMALRDAEGLGGDGVPVTADDVG